jgi:hypothetical protein
MGIMTKIQHKIFLLNAVNNAVAQQRFEGITTSKEVVDDLKDVAEGRLGISDVIKNIRTRHQNV